MEKWAIEAVPTAKDPCRYALLFKGDLKDILFVIKEFGSKCGRPKRTDSAEGFNFQLMIAYLDEGELGKLKGMLKDLAPGRGPGEGEPFQAKPDKPQPVFPPEPQAPEVASVEPAPARPVEPGPPAPAAPVPLPYGFSPQDAPSVLTPPPSTAQPAVSGLPAPDASGAGPSAYADPEGARHGGASALDASVPPPLTMGSCLPAPDVSGAGVPPPLTMGSGLRTDQEAPATIFAKPEDLPPLEVRGPILIDPAALPAPTVVQGSVSGLRTEQEPPATIFAKPAELPQVPVRGPVLIDPAALPPPTLVQLPSQAQSIGPGIEQLSLTESTEAVAPVKTKSVEIPTGAQPFLAGPELPALAGQQAVVPIAPAVQPAATPTPTQPAAGVSGAGVPPPPTTGSGLPAAGVSGAGVPPPPTTGSGQPRAPMPPTPGLPQPGAPGWADGGTAPASPSAPPPGAGAPPAPAPPPAAPAKPPSPALAPAVSLTRAPKSSRPLWGLGMALDEKNDLESILVGPFNRFSHAAAASVVSSPGRMYNPLFIFGPGGVGKTYMLKAIGTGLEKALGGGVLLTSGVKLANAVARSLQEGKFPELEKAFADSKALLVDDLHLLNVTDENKASMVKIFGLFFSRGQQVVLTSFYPARALAGLEESLKISLRKGWSVDMKLAGGDSQKDMILSIFTRYKTDLTNDEAGLFINKLAKGSPDSLRWARRVVTLRTLLEAQDVPAAFDKLLQTLFLVDPAEEAKEIPTAQEVEASRKVPPPAPGPNAVPLAFMFPKGAEALAPWVTAQFYAVAAKNRIAASYKHVLFGSYDADEPLGVPFQIGEMCRKAGAEAAIVVGPSANSKLTARIGEFSHAVGHILEGLDISAGWLPYDGMKVPGFYLRIHLDFLARIE